MFTDSNSCLVIHCQAQSAFEKKAKISTEIADKRHLASSLSGGGVFGFGRRQCNDLEVFGGKRYTYNLEHRCIPYPLRYNLEQARIDFSEKS